MLEDLGVEEEVAVANPTTPRGGDMVEALLASESRRRQEKELRRLQEEEEAKKRADLNSMTLGDLRARITVRGGASGQEGGLGGNPPGYRRTRQQRHGRRT